MLAGDTMGRRAASAWNGLCRAVHHHSYELPPAPAELRGLHGEVEDLLAQLA